MSLWRYKEKKVKKEKKMEGIIPLVKLDNRESIKPVRAVNSRTIAVRAQDLIKKGTAQLSELFYKIKRSGGIHRYLDFKGEIILSTIMRDDLLMRVSNTLFFDLLEGLKPDYLLTIDCETYDNEYSFSRKQIIESLTRTVELMTLFPDIELIGLVKGCDRHQFLAHYRILKRLGIRTFAIHAGDFLRAGETQTQRVKSYASLIKEDNNAVLLAGFGCQRKLEEFSFVNGYITYTHMVNAQNGIIFNGRKKTRNHRMGYHEAGVHNLKQMIINLKDSKNQAKLGEFITWAEDQELQEAVIRKQ